MEVASGSSSLRGFNDLQETIEAGENLGIQRSGVREGVVLLRQFGQPEQGGGIKFEGSDSRIEYRRCPILGGECLSGTAKKSGGFDSQRTGEADQGKRQFGGIVARPKVSADAFENAGSVMTRSRSGERPREGCSDP